MNNPLNMLSNMGSNPIFQLVNILNSGGNPTSVLRQMANSDPRARQAIQMMRGKSPQELREIAQGLAANQGTTIEAVAQSLGLK